MSSKIVVIINGHNQSGKDTFVDNSRSILKGILEVYNFSSVDEVKAEAKEKHGWNSGLKDEAIRALFVAIKQQHILDNDRPTRYLLRKVSDVKTGLIFLHIREPEEINKFYKQSECRVLRLHISRPGVKIATNSSDLHTEECEYDYRIVNDGGLKRYKQVTQGFLKSIYKDVDNRVYSELLKNYEI